MKFAILSNMEGHAWGGSEDLWSGAAGLLLAQGHSVSAYVKDWGAEEAEPLRRLAAQGLRIHRRSAERTPGTAELVLGRVGRRLGLLPPVPSPLARLLAERPDFVLVNQAGGFPESYFLQELAQSGLPYAILFQTAAEAWWPNDRQRDDAIDLMQRAKAIFFVSEGNRRLIGRQLVYEHPNTAVVWNPFRVDYDRPVPWPPPGEKARIAVVGRLEPAFKGCDLVLECLARDPWPGRPVEATFFGSGTGERGVRALAAKLNLPHVRFAGHAGDVASIWRDHHLLFLPSRCEGLSLAVIEALLCGRPCVVTDVSGHGELVDDGATGFVAASPTLGAVAATLERAWSERSRWPAMGAAAAAAIRARVPRSPPAEFTRRLLELAA